MEKVGKTGYFEKEKKEQQKGEEAFFKQGEKPEVSLPWPRYQVTWLQADIWWTIEEEGRQRSRE